MPDDTFTRREYLKSGGAIAAPTPTLLDWGPLGDDGRPNDLEYENGYPVPPDHITEIRDDEAELREFQPQLHYDHLGYQEAKTAKSDVSGMYGWTAESDQYDVIAHCFWVRSVTQRPSLYYVGADWGPDDHFRDHEPIYVFRNPDNTVDTVVCSGGHHYGLWINGEFGPLSEDRVSDRRTHANLRVMRPHNHFMEAETTDGGLYVGEDFPGAFGSFRDQRKTWYDQGHYDKTSHRAVEDPFVFYDESRMHWWRDDTWDAEFNKFYVRFGLNEGVSRNRLKYEEA